MFARCFALRAGQKAEEPHVWNTLPKTDPASLPIQSGSLALTSEADCHKKRQAHAWPAAPGFRKRIGVFYGT